MSGIPASGGEQNTNQISDDDMLGFEDDHRTPQMGPVNPTCSEWRLAVWAARFAAVCNDRHGGGAPLKYKQLIRVAMQLVAGVIYYLTFTAVDLNDKVEKVYRAKVWATVPHARLEFMFCHEFTDSKESAKQMREKINPTIAKLPAKYRRLNNPRSSKRANKLDDQERRGDFRHPEAIAPANKYLLTNGFRFLVKEIREQNPSWKYVREKMPHINKAMKKFFVDRGSKTSDFC